MGVLYLLFETASGFSLFERIKSDEATLAMQEGQKAILNLKKFSTLVKLKAFVPFTSAAEALENINAISEGDLTPILGNFLEQNVPKGSSIGVMDSRIGNSISENLGYKSKNNELTQELLRGIRLHFTRFIKGMKDTDLGQAMLGLGHSYSRAKVKFNVHKVDNMIIQSISLLDTLDKDLNTFAMRVREWYGWHFPELVKIISDNQLYARLALLIKDKGKLSEESVPAISDILSGDDDKAREIVQAAKMSMGHELSEIDLLNIDMFTKRVVDLWSFRSNLYNYLIKKMDDCAPNLCALVGEQVGARLICHAGSLTSLAKYPASTVQILGAEKALFRALKTKGNTPKYGLIFHSSFIGRAATKNKGRISRYLANKCSIASRIDCFGDTSSNVFGKALKQQVEDRLEFYSSGTAPKKNLDVMKEAFAEAELAEASLDNGETPGGEEKEKKKKKKKDKKRAAEEMEATEEPPKKKKKKSKKVEAEATPEAEAPKKKKKKSKKA